MPSNNVLIGSPGSNFKSSVPHGAYNSNNTTYLLVMIKYDAKGSL